MGRAGSSFNGNDVGAIEVTLAMTKRSGAVIFREVGQNFYGFCVMFHVKISRKYNCAS